MASLKQSTVSLPTITKIKRFSHIHIFSCGRIPRYFFALLLTCTLTACTSTRSSQDSSQTLKPEAIPVGAQSPQDTNQTLNAEAMPDSTIPLRSQIDISEETLQSFQDSLAHTPYLQAMYEQLQSSGYDESAYSLTHDNSFYPNWSIMQTPDVWGQKPANVKIGAGVYVPEYIENFMIAKAQHFVDITTLWPFPDGDFQEAIINGLNEAFKGAQNKKITVRILVGNGYPFSSKVTKQMESYLQQFITKFQNMQNNELDIYVAVQQHGAQFGHIFFWNHAKMVVIDGKQALLGGENFVQGAYLEKEPVHDLNISLYGSFANSMHKFADLIWSKSCGRRNNTRNAHWTTGMTDIDDKCPPPADTNPVPWQGKLSVLGAGRYAGLVDHGNPSDFAMLLALNSSTKTIRIAQQDLLWGPFVWKPGMTAIANALINKRHVYIVLSNDNGRAGNGDKFSSSTLKATANKIRTFVKHSKLPNKPKTNSAVNDLLCKYLHLAPLRFAPSPPNAWPNGYGFANHSKFFMVDEKIFYVGSSNLYPADLIEYGVFMTDPVAIQTILERYWNPLWSYSNQAAISGKLPYQTRILETPTTFICETDGTWLMADYTASTNPDLVFIKTGKTPSGRVEVHIASGSSNYQTRVLETPTTFGCETDGTWLMATYNTRLETDLDLIFIKTSNTPSGKVEVHIASGSSNYQTRVLETPTTFGCETDGTWLMADYDKDAILDLIFIKTSNTPSGMVEVHIASGSSNYQTRILETKTTFGCETDGTWLMARKTIDSLPDLVFIKTSNTPSGKVEVHIASGSSNYQTRILETPTTFECQTDGTWQMVNYYNWNSTFPLIFIKTSNTPTNHVEVHVAEGLVSSYDCVFFQ